ncbi:hypothetical protein THRCLA_08339, partial [Thraustotheca clavata]
MVACALPALVAAANDTVQINLRADGSGSGESSSHTLTVVLIGVGIGLVIAIALICVYRKCRKRRPKAPDFEEFIDPNDRIEQNDPFKSIPQHRGENPSNFNHLRNHRPTELSSPSSSIEPTIVYNKQQEVAQSTTEVTRNQSEQVSFRYKIDPPNQDYGFNIDQELSPTTLTRSMPLKDMAPAPAPAPTSPRNPIQFKQQKASPPQSTQPKPSQPKSTPPKPAQPKPTPPSPPEPVAPVRQPRTPPKASAPANNRIGHQTSPTARKSIFDSPIELPPEGHHAARPKSKMTPEMRAAKKAALINQLSSARAPIVYAPPARATEVVARRPSANSDVSLPRRQPSQSMVLPPDEPRTFLPLPAAPVYQAAPTVVHEQVPHFDMNAPYSEEESYLTCVDNANDTLPLGAEAENYQAREERATAKSELIKQLPQPAPTRDVLNHSFLSGEHSHPSIEEQRPRHFELRSEPPKETGMIYLPSAAPTKPYQREFTGAVSTKPFQSEFTGAVSNKPFQSEFTGAVSNKPFQSEFTGAVSNKPFQSEFTGAVSNKPFRNEFAGAISNKPFQSEFAGAALAKPFQ